MLVRLKGIDNYMSKSTIITGVAGTTGSEILDLLSKDDEVVNGDRIIIGIDNYFRGCEENISTHLGKSYFASF